MCIDSTYLKTKPKKCKQPFFFSRLKEQNFDEIAKTLWFWRICTERGILYLLVWVFLLELDSILEFYCLMGNPLTAALPRKARDQTLIFTLSAVIFNLHSRHEIFKCKEKNLERYKMDHSQVITELVDMQLFLVAKRYFCVFCKTNI